MAKIEEIKQSVSESIPIEKAIYLARQSFRYGYYNGATQANVIIDVTKTFDADSIKFEELINPLLNTLQQ